MDYQYLANTFSGGLINPISKIINKVYHSRNENPWLISGSPRSGTTWLAEVIASSEKSRLIWEPLQEGNPVKHNYVFSKRPLYLPDGNNQETDDSKQFFKQLLKGENLNFHTLRLVKYPRNILKTFKNERLIIKFVRGNGVVGYLYEHFNIPKPVVIIRHPCAVIASQLRMGRWDDHPHIDENLIKQYPHIKSVIENASSLEEQLAVTWAGDVLAAKLWENNIQIVYYEDLVLKGNVVLEKIFSEWGYNEVPENCLNKLNQPSSTSKYWSEDKSGMEKLKGWSEYLSDEQVSKISNTIKKIGINDYDDLTFLPKLNCR
ncbi:sulfotransferase [Methanohalophilus portucalensis]|uniref:Sulfotransferase family protein n=2 Tax=Methanohalophilus portucalensis TaxID=39664 RepID=A0A1X7P106_9EURY|nr:sulfotransferase [Methanohalophilus portucalensis]ATU08093.1 hypothetical protein BKM01_04460 [Methanohalophilus portucalensis]RNI10069.1 hypothetical protein EFE41_08420 [Methanohalophilus portucalensis FDF-1]SMH44432.1 Sulfotransferase family protein [Methanohalophilus portucalensis FDF-1]